MINKKKICASAMILGAAMVANSAFAACPAPLPSHAALQTILRQVIDLPGGNGGLGNNMWATIVTKEAVVCDVAYSGIGPRNQWPGSRVISAQKANTANAFSLAGNVRGFAGALSTANLYSATQPGGSLFGLQESNPVNVAAAYAGSFSNYGTSADPLINAKIGGVNVFGGGLALYDASKNIVGGIGVSGDSSCADHNIAWRVRWKLGLDAVPAGVSGNGDDNIVYDIAHGDAADSNGNPPAIVDVPVLGKSASGWGHPQCSAAATTIARTFPKAGTVPAPF